MLKDSDSNVEPGLHCHLTVDSDSTSDLDSVDGTESDENDIALEVGNDGLCFCCLYAFFKLYTLLLYSLSLGLVGSSGSHFITKCPKLFISYLKIQYKTNAMSHS